MRELRYSSRASTMGMAGLASRPSHASIKPCTSLHSQGSAGAGVKEERERRLTDVEHVM
jgi:hypothetical protein